MDTSEAKTTYDTSQSKENNEEQGASAENEPWEDEFNPLGLLDLVYVEDEQEKHASINETGAASISTKTDGLEEQKHTSDDSVDSDEGDELEPVAAVDVLPGREEDFFPEGMTQEFMEPSRSTWITTSRVSNAAPSDHQWSQLVYGESILQRVLEVPREIWPVQNQPLDSHSPHQFTWELAQQVNASENNLSELNQLSRPWKHHLQQEQTGLARRQYYQRYRQKNPELVRIRNREYARRYRQAHAERVRERQRAYIKRYRERKRLEQEQAGLLDTRSEEPEIITVSENGLHAAILLNRNNSKKDIVDQNTPVVAVAMKSKNSEHILDSSENNEIVMLS